MKHIFKAIPLVAALAFGLSPAMTYAQALHTVKSGDTLWGLSQNYDVSVNDIKTWNNLKTNSLYIGQKLVLESAKNKPTPVTSMTYIVKAGDTLSAIATRNKVTVANLQKWNNLKTTTIYVGQKLQLQATPAPATPAPTKPAPTPTPTTPTQTYTVKSGDTLYSIATKHKVTVAEIQKWNKLSNTNITVGQKLAIGTATTEGPATVITKKVGVVKANVLNVRKGAGTSFELVGTLKDKDTVTILEEKSGWVHVEFAKIKGWVSKDYLTIKTTTTETPKEVVKEKALYQVTASVLNVRKDPSTGNNLIDTIANGTVVEELERKGTWSQIAYGTKKGWVSNEFLKKKTTAPVARNKAIVIDAGHGGSDSGAPGNNGFHEEHANLAISLYAQSELEARGYKVAMIRTGDYECNKSAASTSSELQCRLDKVTQNKGDIYISIHNNSATATAAKGTETYYTAGTTHSAESLRLANSLHKHYQPVFGSQNRNVQTANYYVTKYNTVPSVLLEVGFMSNADDFAKLKSTTYQQKVGKAIADGVDEYFGF